MIRRHRRRANWIPIALLLACASACGQSRPDRPAPATRSADDWQALFVRSYGWTGGDGAATIPLPGNRTLWLFGDSWIGPVRDGKHIAGSAMVNNVIAVQPIGINAPPADKVTFYWGPKNAKGEPTAWIVPPAEECAHDKNLRYWPACGGIVVPDRDGSTLFLFFARIRDSGAEGIWNFEGCGTAIARIDNPEDAPTAWRIRQTTLTRVSKPVPRGARRIQWGTAALRSDAADGTEPAVLIFGVDSTNGFNKKLLLARAPAATLDRFEAWSFRHENDWSSREEDAKPIADNVMDEFTISRLATTAGPRFVMIYSKPILDDHIVSRVAVRPEGPWSAPREIYRCPEPSRDKRLFAYSAKAHPELSRPGELLITYCVNSTDFWHMAAEAWIYQPRFVRVRMSDMLE